MNFNILSREYIWMKVVTDDDLTGATAQVTFLAAGVIPGESDWEAAELVIGDETHVRILVSGPGQAEATGAVELAGGDYQSWVRITDEPERPVRRPGVVTVS